MMINQPYLGDDEAAVHLPAVEVSANVEVVVTSRRLTELPSAITAVTVGTNTSGVDKCHQTQ